MASPTFADLARITAGDRTVPQLPPELTLAMLLRSGALGPNGYQTPGQPSPLSVLAGVPREELTSPIPATLPSAGEPPPGRMPPTLGEPPPARATPFSDLRWMPEIMRPPTTATNALGPQSREEAERFAASGRNANLAFEASGLGPLRRAGLHASEGRVLEALGNAGIAALPYRPLAGIGTLATAYGGALGADILGAAQPASPATAQTPPPEDGLNAVQRRRRDHLAQRLRRLGNRMPEPEQEELTGLNAITADFIRARNAATIGAGADRQRQERGEYDRRVRRAEAARDAELARGTRFQDTNVGRLWQATGGLAPVAVGGITGAISRAATGGGRPLLYNYLLPGAEGALGGALSYNVPLAYDAFLTPTENPERRGFEAYGRELPMSHPERQRWIDYARGLPEANPIRRTAAAEFYDPNRAAERMLFGGAEGLLGALLGSGAIRMGSRARTGGPPPAGPSGPAAPPGPAGPPPPQIQPPGPAGPAGPPPAGPAPNAPAGPSLARLLQGGPPPVPPPGPAGPPPPMPRSAQPRWPRGATDRNGNPRGGRWR